MVYQCRRSSQHQTTGVQLLSKHHFPQTRDHLSEDPLLTHPCFHFSVLAGQSLVEQVQQTGSESPFSHSLCTHQPPDTLQCLGCHPWKFCAWTPEVFQQTEGTSASHVIQKQSCAEHQVPSGPRLSLRPRHGTFLDLPFSSFAKQQYSSHWGPPPCPPSQSVTSSVLRAEEYGQSLPWPTFLLCQPPWCVQTFLSSSHAAAAWAILVTGLVLISGNSHRLSLQCHHLLQLQQWPSLQESPWPPDSFRGGTSWRDTVDCFLLSARRSWCPELQKQTVLATTL